MNREARRFLLLNLAATAGMALLAAGILWLSGRPPLPASWAGPATWPMQLLWGTLVAVAAAALLARLEPRGSFFEHVQRQVIGLLRRTRLGPGSLALVAAGAGLGEELLFREALQPLLGLWITSALFALVHGTVLASRSWSALACTALLLAGGIVLGLLYERAGLLAAVWAHALYDWAMLLLAWRQARGRGELHGNTKAQSHKGTKEEG